MKKLTPIVLLFTLAFASSCSLKNAIEDGFRPKSEISSLAESKTLAERYGNGKTTTVKLIVPLTEDSLGYYDIDEVLGGGANRNDRHWYDKIVNYVKLQIYNLAVRFNFFNSLKYSTQFKFMKVDPKIFKKVVITRAFFTTEGCGKTDRDCNDYTNGPGKNFDFVKKFWVNISSGKEVVEDGTPEDAELEVLRRREFIKQSKRVFTEEDLEDRDLKVEETLEDNGINLLKYENRVPSVDLKFEGTNTERGTIFFKAKSTKRLLINYFYADKFKKIVKTVYKHDEGVKVKLHKPELMTTFMEIVKGDQVQISQRVFIYRLDTLTKEEYREAVRFFKSKRFKSFVAGVFTVGRSIYVELKSRHARTDYMLALKRNQSEYDDLKIHRVDSCRRSNCVEIIPDEYNLVPMLEKNPMIKLDTFISVQSLGRTDFKYNGFIEVEITLDLPI